MRSNHTTPYTVRIIPDPREHFDFERNSFDMPCHDDLVLSGEIMHHQGLFLDPQNRFIRLLDIGIPVAVFLE